MPRPLKKNSQPQIHSTNFSSSTIQLPTEMKPEDLRKKLQGVISFPCTPFKKDLSLDLDGLRKNLRLLLKHPIAAIVAPAGTGEIHSLSPAEPLAVLKTTLKEVKGRVPVLTGAGFNPPIAADMACEA